MAFTVGQEITEGFSTDYPGETFTILTSTDPAGTAWMAPSMIEETGTAGDFLVRFTPALVGDYYAHWAGDRSKIHLDGNWAVEASRVVPGFAGVGTSKKVLRRRIGGASGLGDYLLLLSTAIEPAQQTFTDVNRLMLPVGAYDGRELYFASGANRGQTRRIAGSSEVNRSLTLDPLAAFPVALGTEGELWNTQGSGWHQWEVDTVINDIITEARTGWWIPQSFNLEGRFDPTNPYVAIPPTLSYVYGVGWQDDGGLWQEEPQADYPGGNGWFADPATLSIRLGGPSADRAQNHPTQIRGYGPLAELVDDEDVTPLNVEWLVKEAVCRLLLMALQRRPENQVKFPAAKRRSDESRPFALLRPSPDTVRIA